MLHLVTVQTKAVFYRGFFLPNRIFFKRSLCSWGSGEVNPGFWSLGARQRLLQSPWKAEQGLSLRLLPADRLACGAGSRHLLSRLPPAPVQPQQIPGCPPQGAGAGGDPRGAGGTRWSRGLHCLGCSGWLLQQGNFHSLSPPRKK